MREEEIEQLYTRLEKPLCNVVFRWLWDMDDAQDVVQEAFVRLWRMRTRVDIDTVEPLVYKIALNLATSRRRWKQTWKWMSLSTVREWPSVARRADEALLAGEEHERLRAAVDTLPEDLRRVIMLCAFSDLSYQEIAEALSIPAGTVGSRRHRALRQLRQHLTDA
jgi:RNA polymerase sigma-70 factor (ECF subfamily)